MDNMFWLSVINEWSDEHNIEIIMSYNFQTNVWKFEFFKKSTLHPGYSIHWEYSVPQSYLDCGFMRCRNFSVLKMLAEAETALNKADKDEKTFDVINIEEGYLI